MASYQFDPVKNVVEFESKHNKIGIVNHLVAQCRLCRGHGGRVHHALIVLPQQRRKSFRVAHDGGNHLVPRNRRKDGIHRLASELGDEMLRQRAGIPENNGHASG